jgi:hypothetical protein
MQAERDVTMGEGVVSIVLTVSGCMSLQCSSDAGQSQTSGSTKQRDRGSKEVTPGRQLLVALTSKADRALPLTTP